MVFGSLDEFHVQLFVQSSLSLQKLLQDLVVHAVSGEELLVGQRTLVGHRHGVNLPVLGGVFQLHSTPNY